MLVRTFNIVLLQNGDMSQPVLYSPPFVATAYVDLVLAVAVQSFITGSPNGSMKIQCNTDPNGLNDNTKWKDMPGSNQLVVGSTDSPFWNLSQQGYLTFRVVYTSSSGSGSLTIRVEGKGN